MRAKQIFSWIPVPAQVKLVYARLTLNKLTTLYFVLAIVHCVLQVILQLAAHAINVDARHLVTHILEQARLTMEKFALVENKRSFSQARETDLTLTLCRGIPGQFGFTGKDVCDVLWSQKRGLINETVDDFISPSSESDKDKPSSDSSEDDKKTSPIPVRAPTTSASIPSSSTTTRAFGTTLPSTSLFVVSSTSVGSTSTVSSSTSRRTTSLASPTTTSSLATSTSLVAPTDVGNLIRPVLRPGSSGSSGSHDSDDDNKTLVRLFRRRVSRKPAAIDKREGERKVFDRERIRPLSLPPRSLPRTPARSPSADIDESHPNLKAHIRRAHVAPITNSLLKRTRGGLSVEYVPLTSRTADPKRFTSRRSKRTKHLATRSTFDEEERDVKIAPVWKFKTESDDDKSPDGNSTMSMSSAPVKPILVSVKVSGLAAPVASEKQVLANNNTATFHDVELSPGCVLALSWPAQVLRDFAREDLAMIGFQVWLFGMSIVAILNESVPHMAAGLFTQALSTGWSAFQMARSASFQARYNEVIVRGACSGVDVLPGYFAHRRADEIPIVVLNAIFLVAMAILGWKVCRVYGWQTFKRIGASRVMNRAYRLVLAFSIHLQCAVYFIVTSSALWVDELINGSIACFAQHENIYKGIFITNILLLLPWLILGWISVRRENKHMMHAFLGISLLFIVTWAAMFASDVYRWVFATWPFFAAMSVTSFVVLVATTGLAIVCRYNFKKGLALFLQSQQILPGAEFTDAMPDPEKVGFPTQRAGEELPTFSVAFGHGGVPQPPSQMFPAKPASALSRSSTLDDDPPAGYSVNPYATNGSDFWGGSITRNSSGRSKSSTDASSVPTNRTTEVTSVDDDVPRYTPEDSYLSQPSTTRRELPQWEEVRRSQLPSAFDLQPPRMSIQPPIQSQPDRTSVYSSATGTDSDLVDVLRDGQWQRVKARELHRASVVSGVTHTSGFSGASWVPGDDAGPLPVRAPVPVPPVPAYRPQVSPPVAPRAFVGLPGRNIKPHTTPSGRVTQQFSPPKAGGVLGGSAVPTGW
ncbi:Protein FMP27, mitochondrial [Rhizoctonia solani]|uniref:Protein FMP27, mitochondrial n=1 Tax=Rhizoctonia solani TaxID=456999 RepID=A0A0K6G896_9AGAM|nr:Protein FMP27, mitochondrial [Rhizoctonia solani]